MASPITTSGFQVSAVPYVRYPDAASLVPQYGAILPAISQGMNAVGQYQQMAELAQQRPIRRELAQLQLENERAQLAQLPLRRQLAELQLGEAQRQAAIPYQVIEGVELSGGTPIQRSLNPADYPYGGTEIEGYLPSEQITRGRNIGAGGVESPFEMRKTLKTAAEVEQDMLDTQAKRRATEALATSRLTPRLSANERIMNAYNAAVAEGDEVAAEQLRPFIAKINADSTITPQRAYERKVAELAVSAGLVLEDAMELAKTQEGAQYLANMAAYNKLSVDDKRLLGNRAPVRPNLSTSTAVAPATESTGGLDDALASRLGGAKAAPAISAIPESAKALLRKDKSLSDQFDAKYGRGAAAQVLNSRG